MLRSKKIFQIN